MAYYMVILFLATIVLVTAKPLPDYDQGGLEILNGADTRYYGLPAFWFRRPLRDDDNNNDYGTGNGGSGRPDIRRQKGSIPAYEIAGAGWGR